MIGPTPAGERGAVPAGGPALHAGFLEWARRSPEAPALVIGERTWSYGALDDTARRWAGALGDLVDGPLERVAILGARSEVAYAGVLAALFCGAAYVPISPNLPPERIRTMIAASDPDAVAVGAADLPLLEDALAGRASPPPVLVTDGPAPRSVGGARTRGLSLREVLPVAEPALPSGDALAYLLFTSGSTGTPKGVPITHANVGHFLAEALRRYDLGPGDRLTQTFEPTFDLSVFDLFAAWSSGACVCVPRQVDLLSPFRFVREHEVTVWFSVPSAATLLRSAGLLAPDSLPSLRWSLFCGEALTVDTAEAWLAAAPNAALENLYGPTECTIACAAYRWDPDRSSGESVHGVVPIGRPFAGLDALVVDEGLEPVASGSPGELCVAGPQTFAGYWRDPAATAAAFFERAGPDGRPCRYYRTGDRVRALPSGDLAFLGRRDHQVKVLGHRVELGEVESILRAHPGVTEAVVLPVGSSAGTAERLAAFVSGEADPAELEAAARARLPAAVVPWRYHVLAGLPRTPNGKIDRRALAERLG